MRANYKLQRLFVGDDLAAGRTIVLARDKAHYLANVLRMKKGAELLIFNGRDGEWRAAIDDIAKKSVTLAIGAQERAQPPLPDLVYGFAPIKAGRLDYMVQKAVEMGAGIIQPVITQHTQIKKIGHERMGANIIEAAEQCGVLAVPLLREAVSFEKFLADWPNDRQLIFCDEASKTDNPVPILQPLKGQQLGLLIGPEGGFSNEERRTLHALDFVTAMPLGPRILRADTAAVAALAIIQAIAGDWNSQ